MRVSLILLTIAQLPGCVAQRWNDSSIDKAGVKHDRAWIELALYGPLGDRNVGSLKVDGTGNASHVLITEQAQNSQLTAAQLLQLLELVRPIPQTQP